MIAPAPAVVFDQVSVTYGGRALALDHLSLVVPPGQFCVLLAPSGAGKSTLLRVVNGLVRPSQGQVTVLGATPGVGHWRRTQARLATIHQHFNLVARATVLANVLHGALPAIGPMRALLRWFRSAHYALARQRLQDVGLDAAHAGRRAASLSGGQQQRVGIARAFMLAPEVVLADEPVASLDPRVSREILDLLKREAHACGTTVICSLHQVEFAREFADRIVGLRDGRIVFDGPPSALDEVAVGQIYRRDTVEPSNGPVPAADSSPPSLPEPPTRMRPGPPWLTARSLAAILIGLVLLAFTGDRLEMPRLAGSIGAWAASPVTGDSTELGRGLDRLASSLWPPQLAEVTPLDRLPAQTGRADGWWARIETQEEKTVQLDPDTLAMTEHIERTPVLVEPLGYLRIVVVKMVESIEIGLWGTVLAVLLSGPLCWLAARNYAPHPLLYVAARATVAGLRAVPEIVSALFLVVAFGFGPIAGVLALGLHAAGFLGKFYAEDIENASRGPQEALAAIGASNWRILWFAVLPEVLPQYIAYTLYILDRNVRMAAVIGLVGAGGIGQELKGRYDLFQYGHVCTILLALFATVFLLDQLSARVRRGLI